MTCPSAGMLNGIRQGIQSRLNGQFCMSWTQPAEATFEESRIGSSPESRRKLVQPELSSWSRLPLLCPHCQVALGPLSSKQSDCLRALTQEVSKIDCKWQQLGWHILST